MVLPVGKNCRDKLPVEKLHMLSEKLSRYHLTKLWGSFIILEAKAKAPQSLTIGYWLMY